MVQLLATVKQQSSTFLSFVFIRLFELSIFAHGCTPGNFFQHPFFRRCVLAAIGYISAMKDARIALKVEKSLKDELDQVTVELGINEASLVRSCVTALCDYWRTHREVTIPLTLVPASRLAELEDLWKRVHKLDFSDPPAADPTKIYQTPKPKKKKPDPRLNEK